MNVRDNLGSIGSRRGVGDVFAGSDDSLDELEGEAVDTFLEVDDKGDDAWVFSLVLDVENEREPFPHCNEPLE